MTRCGTNGSSPYPPSPCPTSTHTGVPSASSTHGGTAFTGVALGWPLLALVVLLVLAAVLFRIRTRETTASATSPTYGSDDRLVEREVLRFVQENGPVSPRLVVGMVTSSGMFSEDDVRHAIWVLIDRGDLNPDGTLLLRVPQAPASGA